MNKKRYEVCRYVTQIVVVEADSWEAAREQARGMFKSSTWSVNCKESIDPNIDVFEVDCYQKSYPHKYIEPKQTNPEEEVK
jgi:hypothetical protein